MQAGFSIAKSCHGHPISSADRRSQMVKELDVAVRQFLQPRVLFLLTLAFVWAGFIYSYKLSQYQQHPEVTKASLARAWVDHRNDSLAIVSHEQVRPAKLLSLALITAAALALRVAHRTPDLILDEPAPVREAFLFNSLIPFRAPPSSIPSLA